MNVPDTQKEFPPAGGNDYFFVSIIKDIFVLN
jgi:hypothetical protein